MDVTVRKMTVRLNKNGVNIWKIQEENPINVKEVNAQKNSMYTKTEF